MFDTVVFNTKPIHGQCINHFIGQENSVPALFGWFIQPADPVQGAEEIGRSILAHLRQFVVGQDPFDNERIWDDMWQPKLVGRRGITTRVISGIDIAIWDIKGKVANPGAILCCLFVACFVSVDFVSVPKLRMPQTRAGQAF